MSNIIFVRKPAFITPAPIIVGNHVKDSLLGGAGSVVVNFPSGLENGDLLFVLMSVDSSNTFSQDPKIISSGWFQHVQNDGTSARSGVAIYSKFIDDVVAETSFEIDSQFGTNHLNYICASFKNVANDTGIGGGALDVGSANTGSNTGDPNSDPVTTVTDGCLIMSTYTHSIAVDRTVPSGYTELAQQNTNSNGCGIAYIEQAAAGTENAGAWAGTNPLWRAGTYALRPKYPGLV